MQLKDLGRSGQGGSDCASTLMVDCAQPSTDASELGLDEPHHSRWISRLRRWRGTLPHRTSVPLDPTLIVQRVGERDRTRFSLGDFATASESFRRMSRFVRRAHESGVTLLAGTDGGSLFDEMEAYAAAGIPNVDVLRAATVNGAVWLGKGDEFGTIQPGRRADFVLVDGDPLRDIRDARKISAVIKEGRIVVRN